MAAVTRTVRHLRLRSTSRVAIRRTVTVLEDALRTASLPDAAGRVLLVRCLDLGRIDPRARSTTIGLQLERAVTGAELSMCHGAAPGAAAAPAVWFRDALDAHIALALRLVRGPPPSEWFWRLAVPRWHAALDRSESLRSIALSVAALPEAPVALPAWVAAVHGGGYAGLLEGALRSSDVPTLARAADVSLDTLTGSGAALPEQAGGGAAHDSFGRPTRSGSHPGAPSQGLSSQSGIHALLVRLIGLEGARQPASPAVAPAGAGDRGGEGRARLQPMLDRPCAPLARDSMSRSESRTVPERSAGSGATGQAGDSEQPREPPPAARGTKRAGRRVSDRAAGASDANATKRDPATDSHSATFQPTQAGGLLFLIAALNRLRYPEWLEREPEWAPEEVARRLFASVLSRLQVPADDSMRKVTATSETRISPPGSFVAPAVWQEGLLSGTGALRVAESSGAGRLRDASGRLLLGAWHGPMPTELRGLARDATVAPLRVDALTDQVIEAWGVAVRRWLRRYAGIGVADLVLRPAYLSLTPTHLDVSLDPNLAEPRVRRSGLDLDQGWVPWLGRVVAFHYDRLRGG